MAHAEKVPSGKGAYWRGRYMDAEGRWVSVRDEHGRVIHFAGKREAGKAAESREADVRAGRVPAEASETTFAEWQAEWREGLELSWSTMVNYGRHLDDHLVPFFGRYALADIDRALIARWKREERKAGAAEDSVRTYAETLNNVLGDAVPLHISENPAAKKKNKGKRSGGGRAAAQAGRDLPVASPLENLLLSERMAIYTGRDDEFVIGQSMFWNAQRFGEMTGLEVTYVRGALLKVQWQLYEIELGDNEELRAEAPGGFLRCPPKDDSYRDVHMPPFMARLMGEHIARTRPERCPCHGRAYVFRGWGTPPSRAGTVPLRDVAALAGVSETTVRGVLTGRGGTRVGPEKRALVEEAARAAGWKPLPRASGPAPHWRRSGLEDLFATAATGRFLVRKRRKTMAGRPVPLGGEWPGTRLLGRNALARSQWGWLPIAGGDVHPHLERHWVKTWMEHARIPEILSEEVLGHRVPGVSGRYRHVSPEMRADLAAAQTKAWEAALDARLAMSPYSPVAVLRELLGDRAEARKLRILPRLTPEQPEGVPVIGTGTPDDLGGRYWDRTSDLFGVNEGGSAEIQ